MTNANFIVKKELSRGYQMVDCLKRKEVVFPPVEMQLLDVGTVKTQAPTGDRALQFDGAIEISWRGKSCKFVFDCKTQNTPMSLLRATDALKRQSKKCNLNLLVFAPYLSDKSLQLLESEGVSGIDFCGNGIILAPNFTVWRSGNPNRFREKRIVANLFNGVSSMIARCFLLQSSFSSQSEIREFAIDRFNGEKAQKVSALTKGTVSKVMQTLVEEQFVIRSNEGFVLRDPQSLLEGLRSSYRKPDGARLEGKMPVSEDAAWERLSKSPFRAIATGDSSAAHYRTLSGKDKLTLYVDDLNEAGKCLEIVADSLFPNVELIEEKNDLVYFDARQDGNALWSSPIQTWLELSLAGPRERQAAEALQSVFLKGEGAKLF